MIYLNFKFVFILLEPGQADKSEGAEGCRARAKPTGGLEPSPPEPTSGLEPSPPEPSIEPTRAHHRCSGGNAPRGHFRGDLGGGSPNGGDPPISPLEPTSGLGGRGGGGAGNGNGQAAQTRPTPRAGSFLSTFGTPLTLIIPMKTPLTPTKTH